MYVRVYDHPILGKMEEKKKVTIYVDGKEIEAYEGEMIASALVSNGIKVLRLTKRRLSPRGVFCAIGRCTDCVMTVNGVPNIRTCVTPVADGMQITTQRGTEEWGKE